MGITNTDKNTLSHVYKLHNTLGEKKIILAFEGGFTQTLTRNILSLTEHKMHQSGEEEIIRKKVFNVMVECLQNICKHADEAEKPLDWIQDGIFMIGKDLEGYFLVSGNLVNNAVIPFLEEKIIEVNSLDREGLKELYLQKLQESQLSDKGGAGLGLIDIARKSGQKLEYHFEKVDENLSFYTLSTKISKRKPENKT